MKEYICHRWPEYRIGNKVKFSGGWFKTSDPEAMKVIESNDWYGVFIFPADGKGLEKKGSKEKKASDKEGGGGLSASLEDNGETARPGAEELQGCSKQGRETGSVFQELEELVRGSGIASG